VSDGPSYIVHQPDGTTFGPADVAMLKEWVAAGIVTRTTALSIQGDERRTPAAVVPGLFKPEPGSQATVKPAEPMYQAHLASGTTDALTLADLGRMVEAGDVVSTTPISLVGGSKKVPAAVVPGIEGAFRRSEGAEPRIGSSEEEYPSPADDVAGQMADGHAEKGCQADQESPGQAESSSATADPLFELMLENVASFLGALVLGLIVIAVLTKVGWPQHPVEAPGHGKLRLLALAQVLLISQWFQMPSAHGLMGLPPQLEAWFVIPVAWCALSFAILKIRCRFDSREDGVWPWLFGVILGIWYAALLSATWFGPHPIALRP